MLLAASRSGDNILEQVFHCGETINIQIETNVFSKKVTDMHVEYFVSVSCQKSFDCDSKAY